MGEGPIEGVVFEDRASFTCPFCGGKISVASEIEGAPGEAGGMRVVLHSMPACEKYAQEDALVFLRNARVAAFGRAPDDDEWPVGPTGDQGDN